MWKVYADGNLVLIIEANSKEHAINRAMFIMIADGQCDTIEGLVFYAKVY